VLALLIHLRNVAAQGSRGTLLLLLLLLLLLSSVIETRSENLTLGSQEADHDKKSELLSHRHVNS